MIEIKIDLKKFVEQVGLLKYSSWQEWANTHHGRFISRIDIHYHREHAIEFDNEEDAIAFKLRFCL